MATSLILRSVRTHLIRNPGSLFIAAFVASLLVGAAIYAVSPFIANELTMIMFFALAYGLLLESMALLTSHLRAKPHRIRDQRLPIPKEPS